MTHELTQIHDTDLEAILDTSATETVVVYFTAEWCGPCRFFGPRLVRYQNTHPSRAIREVDGDVSPNLLAHFEIRAYPTVIALRKGKTLWRSSGDKRDAPLFAELDAAFAFTPDGEVDDVEVAVPRVSGIFTLPATAPSTVHATLLDKSEYPPVRGIAKGESVRVDEASEVALTVQSDASMRPSLELSCFAEFAKIHYSSLDIVADEITADHLRDVARLHSLAELRLHADQPLSAEAMTVLTALPIRTLDITIPGVEADTLITAMPSVVINGVSRAKGYAPLRTAVTGAEPLPQWRSPADLVEVSQTRLVVAMLQVEHPQDRGTAAVWHTMLAERPDDAVFSVSVHRDELARTAAIDARHPAIVVLREGTVVWRRDLPDTAEACVREVSAAVLFAQDSAQAAASFPLTDPAGERRLPLHDGGAAPVFITISPPRVDGARETMEWGVRGGTGGLAGTRPGHHRHGSDDRSRPRRAVERGHGGVLSREPTGLGDCGIPTGDDRGDRSGDPPRGE